MKIIALTPGEVQLFESQFKKEKGCWNWEGTEDAQGYGVFYYKRGEQWHQLYSHRVSYSLYGTEPIDKLMVDHKCHNTLCLNPEHLRTATHQQNQENREGANRNSRTGVRGVYIDSGKYRVTVTHKGKRYRPGCYDSLEEAERVAVELRARLHSHLSVSDLMRLKQ